MRLGVKIFVLQIFVLQALLVSYQDVLAQKANLDSLETVLKDPHPDTARIKVLQKLALGYLSKEPVKSLRYSDEAKTLSQKTGNRKATTSSLQLMARALRADHKDSLALVIADRSLILAKELGDPLEISGSLGVLNSIYESQDIQKCIPVLEEKIRVDKKLNDPIRLSTDYQVLGDKFRMQGKNDLALENFTIGYNILIKAGMREKTGRCLQGMAGQNYIMTQYETAVSMLSEAIQLNKSQKDWNAVGDNYNLMGIVYRRKGPQDSAIYWYNQCLELFTQRNERARKVYPLNNLGNIYQDMKQFEKAIEYRRKSIAVCMETNQKNQIGGTLNSLALTYLDMKEYDKALLTIDSAYNINKAFGAEWETRRLLFQTKAKVYEIQGKTDSSLFYFKKYIDIRDSIYGKESTEKMMKLKIQLETQQKEDQILFLKKDNEIKSQLSGKQSLLLQNAALREEKSKSEMALLSQTVKLEKAKSIHNQWELQIQKLKGQVSQNKLASLSQKQRLMEKEKLLNQSEVKERILERNLLIIGSVLLGALAILIFFRIRIFNQKARIQTLTRISRDLHDNVGSTLGSITMYSEMAKTMRRSGSEKLEEVLGKIEENSRESVDMMADIVWSLNPINEPLEKLMLRLQNYAADVLQTKGVAVHFEMDEKLESHKTSLEERTNLFLIAKETLFNASKYSLGSAVSIRFQKISNGLLMTIEDNGQGFSDREIGMLHNGNGIRNMKMRAKEIKAELTINSTPGNGTRITVQLA